MTRVILISSNCIAIVLLKIFICLYSSSVKALIFEGNSLVPADDEELIYDRNISQEEREIVARTVNIKNSLGSHGTGFLFGEKCQKIYTVKHNFYEPITGKKKYKKSAVLLPNNKKLKIVGMPEKIEPFRPHPFRGEVDLIEMELQRPYPNAVCREFKKFDIGQLKEGDSLDDCIHSGYPGEVVKTDVSLVKRRKNIPFVYGKRGYDKCSVKRAIGTSVIHNCDSGKGSSGGPIACKVDGEWMLVGVVMGGICNIGLKKCYSENHSYKFTSEIKILSDKKKRREYSFGVASPFLNTRNKDVARAEKKD